MRDGAPIGLIKEWDSGRVTFDITMVDAQERARLISELLEVRLFPFSPFLPHLAFNRLGMRAAWGVAPASI